jgi:hypothetical protein
VIRTEAVRYLIAKGWPMRQASALVGVFMDGEEIDIRPDRRVRFHDYASSNGGLDLHDSATRLNFLGWELGNGYAALGSKFFAADTVEEAVRFAALYRHPDLADIERTDQYNTYLYRAQQVHTDLQD